MQIKLIFTRKILHLASFWKREFWELGKGQLTNTMVSSTRIRIFLKTTIFLHFEKNTPRPTRSLFKSFSPLHSKTLADDGNTIASLTGHALYDVWRHRVRKPSFSSVHTITISTLFLKKLHYGNRFRKAAFLMHENAVDVWTQGLSPFSKIPRYVWIVARSSLDVSWWVSRLLQKQTNDL